MPAPTTTTSTRSGTFVSFILSLLFAVATPKWSLRRTTEPLYHQEMKQHFLGDAYLLDIGRGANLAERFAYELLRTPY